MVKEEWNAIIAAKLKEGTSIEDLKHTYAEGIEIEPNVMASDIESYSHTLNVNDPWVNMAMITEGSTADKNSAAMQALQYGANGLSFTISQNDNVSDLLKGILTEYLDVRLDCQSLSEEDLKQKRSEIDPSEFPNVRWIHTSLVPEMHIPDLNRVSEIRRCIQSIEKGRSTDIVFSVSKQLLFEVASIRALRALLEEKQIESYSIVCRYDVDGENELGDYNLIEKTYKIMSAVLGGANAILSAYDGTEDARLTLNIHNVLDLESGMKNVMDPLAGAYYIEKLTGEIIRQVKEEN